MTKGEDQPLAEKPLDLMPPRHSEKLTTTTVKTLIITVKARRRPAIPRTMTADVIFAHGPFLSGDYQLAERLLFESTIALHFCVPPPPKYVPPPTPTSMNSTLQDAQDKLSIFTKDIKAFSSKVTPPMMSPRSFLANLSPLSPDQSFSKTFSRSLSRSFSNFKVDPSLSADVAEPKEPVLDIPPANFEVAALDINPASTEPAPPRRMVILLLGIKPHRLGLWSSSLRPSESVIQYLLLDGCPAIVVPVKPGSPLISWDTLTLDRLHEMGKVGKRSAGVVRVIFEYVSLCVDWERVIIPEMEKEATPTLAPQHHDTKAEGEGSDDGKLVAEASDVDGRKQKAVRDAIELLVEACLRSRESKEVKSKVDADRAGIVMFRLP
ncbi:hypothetical protein FRB96_006884 [Tulasnella sp. 330]|nr:hypothetical protein FRB96_006884 [Tulasnella sp. 330]KAG8879606.1 hypothetical protein FRB97_001570 [Tulasnella sp. 331]